MTSRQFESDFRADPPPSSSRPPGPAHGARPPAVEARDLSVSFGSKQALSDVTFTIPAGAFVAVVGPNAAGKTTLLRVLLGTLKHTGSAAVRGRTAYVPQLGAVETAFPVDALGVVLMGRYPRLGWRRRPGAADRRLARELLERVGLDSRARTAFGELSGGQRQRALVARALAQDGEVLLLDEPLNAVDGPSQDTILGVLEEQRDAGRTICMTTHDLVQAARVCDRMLLLSTTLVADGPSGEVLRADTLRRAYGVDFMVLDGQAAVLDDGAHHHSSGG